MDAFPFPRIPSNRNADQCCEGIYLFSFFALSNNPSQYLLKIMASFVHGSLMHCPLP